jgi:hypothetical protein
MRISPPTRSVEDGDQLTRRLNCYLAEYNSLRAEQLSRLQSQNQSFNYLLIIIGATVGLVATVVTKVGDPNSISWLTISIGLLLPLISAPLGFIFFDNEMAVYSIGSRIYADLRPSLGTVTSDHTVLENALAFKNLHRSSGAVHRMLSVARWVLFLIPTFLPLCGLFVYVLVRIGDAQVRSNLFATTPRILLIAGGSMIFVIDIAMCALIFQAILWSVRTLRRLHD